MNPLRRILAFVMQSRRKQDIDLIYAAAADQLDEVKKLISNGADVNAKDDLGITVLAHAAHAGHTKVIKYLLEQNANPNYRDAHGRTALGLVEECPYLVDNYEAVRQALKTAGAMK
jgi:ankyrin repeat protein